MMGGFRFSSLSQGGAGALMGVLNVTPDSFSEAGRDFSAAAAIEHGVELVRAGAVVLDVGAEASSFFRKGVMPVEAGEQLRRLLPVVEGLRRKVPGMLLSIDTRSAAVAEACLARGAAIINDISAGTEDPRMFEVAARAGAGMVLMHIMPGYPATAGDDADIVETVRRYLAERVAAAEAAGIARERLAVDPGVGFGKSMADSWRLVMAAREGVAGWKVEGVGSVLGVSRKRFLETPPPSPEVAERLRELAAEMGEGRHVRDRMTWAVTKWVGAGVGVHRVHAVKHERPKTKDEMGGGAR